MVFVLWSSPNHIYTNRHIRCLIKKKTSRERRNIDLGGIRVIKLHVWSTLGFMSSGHNQEKELNNPVYLIKYIPLVTWSFDLLSFESCQTFKMFNDHVDWAPQSNAKCSWSSDIKVHKYDPSQLAGEFLMFWKFGHLSCASGLLLGLP